MSSAPFWGDVGVEKWSLFFVSAPKVPFFGTGKRAILAKVPVLKCQKMALWAPKQKKRDHFLLPTTPQNGKQHVCFMRIAFLGGF